MLDYNATEIGSCPRQRLQDMADLLLRHSST